MKLKIYMVRQFSFSNSTDVLHHSAKVLSELSKYQNIICKLFGFFVFAVSYDNVIAVRGILCMYVQLLCTGVYSTNYIKKSEAFLQNKKELYAEGIEKQYIFTAWWTDWMYTKYSLKRV